MVTPSCSQALSPSRFSSKVKPYWNPEQPPPCTKTRRGLPCESGMVLAKYLTLSTAAGVSSRSAPGAVRGTGFEDSRVEDMDFPFFGSGSATYRSPDSTALSGDPSVRVKLSRNA